MANTCGDFDGHSNQFGQRTRRPELSVAWGSTKAGNNQNIATFKAERGWTVLRPHLWPVTDGEVSLRQYKAAESIAEVICDKFGVEVTLSKVRRVSAGHIELASPCCTLVLKGRPSRIGHRSKFSSAISRRFST